MRINKEPLHAHRLPTAALSVAASADGTAAYVGCMDGVYRVNMADGQHQRLATHDSYVSGVVLREDARQLITAGYDGHLKWIDLERGEVIRDVVAHRFWSWQLAISPDKKRVASVTGQYLAGSYEYEPAPEVEPSARVYDADSGELLLSLSHVPSVQSVAFSPDGKWLAAGNLMGEVRVWDVTTGDVAARWTTPDFTSWGIIKSHCYIGGIYDLHFTADGEHVVLTGMGPMRDPMAGNGKQTWQKFAWRKSEAQKVQEYKGGEGLMETLAFTPDGQYFTMAGRLRGGDWNTALFRTGDGSQVDTLDSKYRVTQAVFAEDGQRLWLAGTTNQGDMKDGKFADFGRLHVYQLQPENV